MSRSRSVRAALSRVLVLPVVVSGVLLGTAGSSLAATTDAPVPATAGTVPSGFVVAGLSLGTFTWALVGFTLLVLGFIAASRSGRRSPATARPLLVQTGAGRSTQPSSRESQGESTSAAVAF